MAVLWSGVNIGEFAQRYPEIAEEQGGVGLHDPPVTPTAMQEDISAAVKMRSSYDDVWRLCYDAYRENLSTMWVPESAGAEGGESAWGDADEVPRTHIAVIKSVVDSVVAALATRAPKMVVSANQEPYQAAAEIAELAVNWWWRQWGGNDAFRRATFDASVCGHGWVKAAWAVEEDTAEPDEAEIEAAVDTAMGELSWAAVADPSVRLPERAAVSRQVRAAARENPTVTYFSEHPVLRRISPFDMFVDPEADRVLDAAWVAQRFWEPVSEVHANDDYDLAARMRVQASGRYSAEMGDEGEQTGVDERTQGGSPDGRGSAERAMLWEYHDIRTGMWCVFADEATEFLIEPRPSPFAHTPFRTPFEMVPRYTVSEDLYPIGDVQPLLGLQLELDDTRSQMMLARRQSKGTLYVAHESIARNEDNRAALKSNLPGEMITVTSSDPLNEQIVALPMNQVDPALFAMTELIHADVERVSGVTELMRGMSNVSRRTATEASLLSDAVTARLGNQLEMHQEIAARVGHRLVLLAQEFMSTEEMVPLVGEDSSRDWVAFSAAEIDGQFHFNVEYGSMQPRDDLASQQKATAVVQLLGPLAGVAVNPVALARYVLDAFDVPNAEQLVLDAEQQAQYAREQAMLSAAGAPPPKGQTGSAAPSQGMLALPAGGATMSGTPTQAPPQGGQQR